MQHAAAQQTEFTPQPHAALPFRDHTILGVCEGIAEDFGFNPVLLRVPLAASVLWNPYAAIAVYFALGAVVLVSRLLFPKPAAIAVDAPHESVERAQLAGPAEEEPLAIAA